MDELLVEVFLEAHVEQPEEVILDVDATDDPLHGKQEERFFTATTSASATCRFISFVAIICCVHGCARRILGAAHGVVPELKRIVRQLREAWPQVRITVRGDADSPTTS